LATTSHLKVNKVYSQPHTNQGSVRQVLQKNIGHASVLRSEPSKIRKVERVAGRGSIF